MSKAKDCSVFFYILYLMWEKFVTFPTLFGDFDSSLNLFFVDIETNHYFIFNYINDSCVEFDDL